MENFVIIASCTEPKEAYYFRYKLDIEGVRVFLSGIENGDVESVVTKKGTIKVMVDRAELLKAVFILNSSRKELDPTQIDEQILKQKKILVPVDFSKNSITACLFAFVLAQNQSAEIKILHIFRDPDSIVQDRESDNFLPVGNYSEISENERRSTVAFIEAMRNDIQKFGLENVKYHFDLQNGKPEEGIISHAGNYNPDFIVIGTKGAGTFPESIVGSFATRVIENTDRPVLIIPENWTYKHFDKINVMYATDFLISDSGAISQLLEIFNPFNAHFNCVHIELNNDQVLSEMLMFNLESNLSKAHPEISIKCHVIPGKDLLKGIQDFVDKLEIDMISFIAPKRSTFYRLFYPNNLKKMVYQSKIPLFIFHPSEKEA